MVSTSSKWIQILKTVSIMWLVVGILASLIYGIMFMLGKRVGLGLLVIIAGGSVSFVVAAAVMVFLDMAADVRKIRGMLEKKD